MSNIRPLPGGMPGFVIGDVVEKNLLPSRVREFLIQTGRLIPAAQVKPRPPLVWVDLPTLRIDPSAHHLHWTLEDAGIGPDLATLTTRRTT